MVLTVEPSVYPLIVQIFRRYSFAGGNVSLEVGSETCPTSICSFCLVFVTGDMHSQLLSLAAMPVFVAMPPCHDRLFLWNCKP